MVYESTKMLLGIPNKMSLIIHRVYLKINNGVK